MARENDEGARSMRQRGGDAAKRVTEPLISAADTLTGRRVERQIAEFSETFTQVVLGLHEDLSAANRRIADLEVIVADSTPNLPEKGIRKLLPNVPAFLLALGALGVALWTRL